MTNELNDSRNFLFMDDIVMHSKPLLTEPKFAEKIFTSPKEDATSDYFGSTCCYCCPIGVWSFF